MPQKKEGGVTLDDLAQMVASGFTELKADLGGRIDKVENRIDRIEGRMDGIEGRMDKIENRIDKIDQHLTEIDDRLLNVERNTAKTMTLVLDLTEEVSAMNAAIELDTRRINDHEHRITHLETATI